jgi:hypothetical protein
MPADRLPRRVFLSGPVNGTLSIEREGGFHYEGTRVGSAASLVEVFDPTC